MAAVSKRQQARNERELQDLLSVSGNSECADCGAKNPSWASWNLGVFLCMRCASLHRKLGTHISKVKSLSMDTWSSDQVSYMRQNGNIASNKIYNPKNRKPDIPHDADEVDSAMERFIRKKYQEKSLSDGRPEPPRRDDPPLYPPATSSIPQAESPPPPLPPKKGKFFGFGLRASSSALGLKHDKKKQHHEPRVESTFHIPRDDYHSPSRANDARYEMTDAELQKKLATLRDMGFTDTGRNTSMLRRMKGNVERTIEALVQLGPNNSSNSSARKEPSPSRLPASNNEFPPEPPSKGTETSNNPYNHISAEPIVGLSFSNPQATSSTGSQVYASNNPFGQIHDPQPVQSQTGLEQSFHSLQLAQPLQPPQALFPHSTGGYSSQVSVQDPRYQTSVAPPVLPMQYQQGYVASPAPLPTNTNPFFQPAPASAQSTGSNPYLQQTSGNVQAPSSPSTNPFLNLQAGTPVQQTQLPRQQGSLASNFNPFGIPPSPTPGTSQQPHSPINQPQEIYGGARPASAFTPSSESSNPFGQQPLQSGSQGSFPGAQGQSSQQYLNYQYGLLQARSQSQPQLQYQTQQQLQPQVPQPQYAAQQLFSSQSNPFQQQFGQQPQSLAPQPTIRHDRNSIMALFNQPQFGSQQLASIPEPASENSNVQTVSYQQQVSPAPSGDIFGNPNALIGAKRSSTMPVSLQSMHSAGGAGSRNPFMTNTPSMPSNADYSSNPFGGGYGTSPGTAPTIAARHASAASVSINNLEGGRHSPDAFASLSARHMR
ncbi:hypothetical protein PV10_02972 [Exophiala mesophila]|uniref:Arf-GAP domain-containing protein n=1 Tax=Exophiala mesophila TaxID=212818 RepID=A0A0D1Y3Q8_EXOME|nr:uncharacterized protein PV10_02972 [Exophiala mesophila]KIV95301.1 hypothetical protein PV10_02972 [Exophiala mesophila]